MSGVRTAAQYGGTGPTYFSGFKSIIPLSELRAVHGFHSRSPIRSISLFHSGCFRFFNTQVSSNMCSLNESCAVVDRQL